MPEEKRRCVFPDIDLGKFVAAVVVVVVHTGFLAGSGNQSMVFLWAFIVGRMAVPFFFMVSSFFCFRGVNLTEVSRSKSSKEARRIRAQVRRLLELYLTWTILYLPLTILGFAMDGEAPQVAVLKFIRNVLFVGENPYSWQLWYLLASVVGFTIVYGLLRMRCSVRRMVVIAVLLMGCGYVISTLESCERLPNVLAVPMRAYDLLFCTARNGFFLGTPYTIFGMVFATNMDRLSKIALPTLLVGLACALLGCRFISPDMYLPFCACGAICLLLLCTRRSGPHPCGHTWCRNASTVIYLTHMHFAVIFIFGIWEGLLQRSHADGVPWALLFTFTFPCTLATSALAIAAKKKLPHVGRVFGI